MRSARTDRTIFPQLCAWNEIHYYTLTLNSSGEYGRRNVWITHNNRRLIKLWYSRSRGKLFQMVRIRWLARHHITVYRADIFNYRTALVVQRKLLCTSAGLKVTLKKYTEPRRDFPRPRLLVHSGVPMATCIYLPVKLTISDQRQSTIGVFSCGVDASIPTDLRAACPKAARPRFCKERARREQSRANIHTTYLFVPVCHTATAAELVWTSLCLIICLHCAFWRVSLSQFNDYYYILYTYTIMFPSRYI